MDKKTFVDHLASLERSRMHFAPHKYLKQFVQSTEDVFNERRLLKSVSFPDKSIIYIVDIIRDALQENKRFRRAECLKVLRQVMKNKASQEPVGDELSAKLFDLFRQFILTGSEEMKLAINACLKDQPVPDEGIKWLTEHYKESEYIVNRLLRYPWRHEQIAEWAREVLQAGKLKDRTSELAGILIEDEIPEDIEMSQHDLMWAIYYSKSSKNTKRDLILKHLDYENYDAAMEVAEQLGIGKISKELLRHYRERARV